MKLSKTQSALILLGLATAASAQTTSIISSSGSGTGSDTSYVHTAQTTNDPSTAQSNQGGPGMGQGGGQQHKGPPPEAIEACRGKSAGTACSFTGRNGESLGGTCFAPPERGQGPRGAASNQNAPGNSAANNANGNQNVQGHPPIACRPDRGGPNGMPHNNQPGQQQRGPNATPGGQG